MLAAVVSSDPGVKVLAFDVTVDTNPEAANIVSLFRGEVVFKTVQMYTKQIPKHLPFEKIFAVSSIEIGCP